MKRFYGMALLGVGMLLAGCNTGPQPAKEPEGKTVPMVRNVGPDKPVADDMMEQEPVWPPPPEYWARVTFGADGCWTAHADGMGYVVALKRGDELDITLTDTGGEDLWPTVMPVDAKGRFLLDDSDGAIDADGDYFIDFAPTSAHGTLVDARICRK